MILVCLFVCLFVCILETWSGRAGCCRSKPNEVEFPPPARNCRERLYPGLAAPSIYSISISINIWNPPASGQGSRYGPRCRRTLIQALLQGYGHSHSGHLLRPSAPHPGPQEGKMPKLAPLSRSWHWSPCRHWPRLPTVRFPPSSPSLSIVGSTQILQKIERQIWTSILDSIVEWKQCLTNGLNSFMQVCAQGVHIHRHSVRDGVGGVDTFHWSFRLWFRAEGNNNVWSMKIEIVV